MYPNQPTKQSQKIIDPIELMLQKSMLAAPVNIGFLSGLMMMVVVW